MTISEQSFINTLYKVYLMARISHINNVICDLNDNLN